MRAPAEHILQKQDSAAELSRRFSDFLAKLDIVIAEFPKYKDHKPSAGVSLDDVLGFVPRYFERVTRGSDFVTQQENRYHALQHILTVLYKTGLAFQEKLYNKDDHLENKVALMAFLGQNEEAIKTITDYFAASTTIGLIQADVGPLMRSLAGFKRRITPTENFINAFKALMEHAGNRSSKMVLMLTAVDNESQHTLNIAEQVALKLICERFKAVAKLADIIVAFRIFSTNQPEKSAEQMLEATRAEQLEQEGHFEIIKMQFIGDKLSRGLSAELTNDELKQISEAVAALKKAKPDVCALRDFYNILDLNSLFSLLLTIRDWETGKIDSTKALHAIISEFIATLDAKLSRGQSLALDNHPLSTAEFTTLAYQIHSWMKNELSDEDLNRSILILRQQNIAYKAIQEMSQIKAAPEPPAASISILANLATKDSAEGDQAPGESPEEDADEQEYEYEYVEVEVSDNEVEATPQEPTVIAEPSLGRIAIVKLSTVLSAMKMSDWRELPPPPQVPAIAKQEIVANAEESSGNEGTEEEDVSWEYVYEEISGSSSPN
jgi:hypothetical protein